MRSSDGGWMEQFGSDAVQQRGGLGRMGRAAAAAAAFVGLKWRRA